MADRYWVGDTDSDWNDANNWASTSGGSGGAGVPGSSDDVIFDDQYTTQDCTYDVAIDILSLTVQSTYDGTIDFDTYDFTCLGDCYIDGGDILFGSGTHTFSADFDIRDAGSGTDYETSTIVFDGTTLEPLTWVSADTSILMYNCTVSGAVTQSNIPYTAIRVENNLTVSGTLTNNASSGSRETQVLGGATLSISGGGTLTGAGTLLFYFNSTHSSEATISQGGTLSIDLMQWNFDSVEADSSLPAGTYDSILSLDTTNSGYVPTLTLGNGTVTIKSLNQSVTGVGIDIDLSANNSDLVITDDVTLDSITTWTKGTGTITFSGTAAQDIDFDGETVEDIVFNKSAETVTLSGNVITDSFTGTDGTLDIDGNDLETTGNFTAADGTVFNDTTGGGLITVGGNFDLNGAE